MFGPLPEEERQRWKEKIIAQQKSGLSIPAWCRNNDVVIHKFYYWKDKFFPRITRSSFSEISEPGKQDKVRSGRAGITLEYDQIQVHLDRGFDPSELKRCLSALGR